MQDSSSTLSNHREIVSINHTTNNIMDISKKDMKHVERAIFESRRSSMMMKHGCVVASGSKIVATGFNNLRNRFHNKFIETSCSCHAEVDALRKIYHNSTTCPSLKGQSKLRSED